MANEWNTSYPVDHTKIGGVPGEIRKLKDSCKDQLDREHETPVDGDATGGEHSGGSAVAYEGTSTPTTRPDGATALADNAIDRGRMWLDDNGDPPNLKRWTGSAFTEHVRALGGWTPASYAGEESVTLPNGLVIKMGTATLSSYTATVTFAAAFSTALMFASTQVINAAGTAISVIDDSPAPAVTGFTILSNAATGSVYWIAIGY